ncbi:MAG TPA: molybdopterin-dependent oxidoreductase, partial [Thermoleophilaceae bacterium]
MEARPGGTQALGRRRAVRLGGHLHVRVPSPLDRAQGVASALIATHYRTCPFCEATCGLEIETEGREVMSVRGDAEDVFSRGFICPKAYGIKQLHEDTDRLTTPLVRRDGELVEASWDEAFEEIDRRLAPILSEHGRNAVAVYLGNPNAH